MWDTFSLYSSSSETRRDLRDQETFLPQPNTASQAAAHAPQLLTDLLHDSFMSLKPVDMVDLHM